MAHRKQHFCKKWVIILTNIFLSFFAIFLLRTFIKEITQKFFFINKFLSNPRRNLFFYLTCKHQEFPFQPLFFSFSLFSHNKLFWKSFAYVWENFPFSFLRIFMLPIAQHKHTQAHIHNFYDVAPEQSKSGFFLGWLSNDKVQFFTVLCSVGIDSINFSFLKHKFKGRKYFLTTKWIFKV